jgi:hypothetical protein
MENYFKEIEEIAGQACNDEYEEKACGLGTILYTLITNNYV